MNTFPGFIDPIVYSLNAVMLQLPQTQDPFARTGARRPVKMHPRS